MIKKGTDIKGMASLYAGIYEYILIRASKYVQDYPRTRTGN